VGVKGGSRLQVSSMTSDPRQLLDIYVELVNVRSIGG